MIELETGARSDGTLVARKARLVLDKGAYCGEGGFFAQMAAMHALGPYELENVHVESSLVYSNNQPSSSIRAPTAPQVCWALEQHMDELAEALGMDPVELRRRTLIEEGSVTATGQVLERVAMKETLEKAVELIGYGQELPEDEAIGVACGWWPCFAAATRCLREAQSRRHRHDRHRRAGERHRRGDGDADVRGRGARDEARGLLAALSGHRRGPSDMGSCGSQTTFNSGRAVIAAAADLREQLLDAAAERARGGAGGSRARRAARSSSRARPTSRSRSPTSPASGTFHGKGAGEVPAGPDGPRGGLPRPARARVVPRAAADRTRGAGQGRPRDGRRPRARGRGGARLRRRS